MAFEVGAVIARLELVTRDFSRGIKKAEEQTADLRMALDQVSGAFGRITAVSGAAFAVISTGLGLAARTGAKFEEAMVNVGAVTGSTGKQLQGLSDIAVSTGEKTIFSAGQVSQAMFALGSQGVKTAAQFKNILKPALDLAAASQSNVAFTTETVLANLRAFRLDFSEAGRVANLFSAANENSALTVGKLAVALTPVAPIAGALGIKIEAVTAALGVLVGAGFDASEAGTALRNILLRVQKPAGKAKAILDKVGLSTQKLGKLAKDPIKLITALGKANLSTADALEIFGTRAVAAFLTLKEGARDMANLQAAITGTNSATRIAEQQLSATTAGFKLLFSAVEGVAIGIFTSLQPAINAFVSAARDVVLSIGSWIKENQGLAAGLSIAAVGITGMITAVAGLITVLAAVGAAGLAFTVSLNGLKTVFPSIISGMNKVKVAGTALSKAFGLVGLAGILGFTLGKVIDDMIRRGFPGLSKALDNFIAKLAGLDKKIDAPVKSAEDFNSTLKKVAEGLIDILPRIPQTVEKMATLERAFENVGISLEGLPVPIREAFQAFTDGSITADQLTESLNNLDEVQKRIKEEQGQGIFGEDLEAELQLQQQFIDQQLGFANQRIEGGKTTISQKEEELDLQNSLISKIGKTVNLEGKLGTVIEGVLSGTNNLNESFGKFIKSIGLAIAKALILQAILGTLKALFGKGPIGKILGFREGGVVPGAQAGLLPPREDVLIGIQAGEGVLKRDAVRNIGGAAGVEALNSGGGIGGRTLIINNNLSAPLGITSEAVEQFRAIDDQVRREFLGG